MRNCPRCNREVCGDDMVSTYTTEGFVTVCPSCYENITDGVYDESYEANDDVDLDCQR